MPNLICLRERGGGVSVLIPTPEALKTMTLEEIAEKDCGGKPWRIVDASHLPTDRTFRDAWTDDLPSETVDVDMAKARDIHMDRIREKRTEKLGELDVAFMRAVETGAEEEQQTIAKQKQRLRDLPKQFDLTTANSPEELSALIPGDLSF